VEHVQKDMEAVKEAAAKLGVPIQPVVPQNEVPHTAMVEEIEKLRPDLVIMGRGGKTALGRLLLGSVTAQVIGHSPANVLVVPLGAALSFQRLLVASDGSPYSEAAWKLALAMAKHAGSQLISVTVAPKKGDLAEAEATMQKMLIAAEEAGIPLKRLKGVSPQGVAPDVGVVKEAIQNEVELIIMGSYGRTGLKKLLMGSTTEQVIGHAPCPVLVAKS
jgi:nucleotide-binding universal stress UspA family protein